MQNCKQVKIARYKLKIEGKKQNCNKKTALREKSQLQYINLELREKKRKKEKLRESQICEI